MTLSISHTFIYILIGIFAGLMAGILGIGGGIIVVPGLVFVFQMTQEVPNQFIMHVAAGTSLAAMIFTSIAAISAHAKLGTIQWPVFNNLWPGIALGTVTGAAIAEFIPAQWLKIIFAAFLFFAAYKMYKDVHAKRGKKAPGAWIDKIVSFCIGLKSGLLGVGGGVLIIPYLTYCGVAVRKIAPVSNLCTLTVALVGSVAFALTGWKDMAAVPYATGYVFWPAVLFIAISSSIFAPVGAKLNYILPVEQLKYGFIVILLLTALKMLF